MAAASSGHFSPAMLSQLRAMLTGMHLPAATATQMSALMSGHAANADVANLMSMMTPSARATVMNAMPVLAGQVVTGTVLHFAYAGFLGILFAAVIAAAMMRVPFMRTTGGVIAAGVKFALDAPVSPARVLPRQLLHQRLHLGQDRRSPGRPGISPSLLHQAPVPGEQGSGCHDLVRSRARSAQSGLGRAT
jgi:hypothetical protein